MKISLRNSDGKEIALVCAPKAQIAEKLSQRAVALAVLYDHFDMVVVDAEDSLEDSL